MAENLSLSAIVEKNKMGSDGAFLILLKLTFDDSYGISPIRLVRNHENVTWDGQEWTAFPFELDEVKHSTKVEVPSVVLRVSNVTRAIQSYLEQADGGIGTQVDLYVVHSDHLDDSDPIVNLTMMAVEANTNSQWVSFTLGATNPFRRAFPNGRIIRNVCRYRFKDSRCGYTGTETECDKSLTRCRALNNSARYGGFPGSGTGGVYVLG